MYFFPQALEALGDAIKPYLQEGHAGPHIVCSGVDTGGALVEMNLQGKTADGAAVELELMVPSGMVRMIASAHGDEVFGFGPHPLRSMQRLELPVVEQADEPAVASQAPDHVPEPGPTPGPQSAPQPPTAPAGAPAAPDAPEEARTAAAASERATDLPAAG